MRVNGHTITETTIIATREHYAVLAKPESLPGNKASPTRDHTWGMHDATQEEAQRGLDMMNAACQRIASGKLTAADKDAIAQGGRDFHDYVAPGIWRR